MKKQERRQYDAEFKRQAVTLSMEKGRTVASVAESLGINKDLIYHWRKRLQEKGELAFPGNGKQLLTAEQERIRQLERKLKETEEERDILKKALAIFSQTR